jgi:hypothetical protein
MEARTAFLAEFRRWRILEAALLHFHQVALHFPFKFRQLS